MNFPSTSRQFQVNDKTYTMRMPTLELLARMEDEDIDVSYLEILSSCTNIPKDIINFIPNNQLNVLCDDIIEYSKDDNKTKEKKKTIELIAWLINKGHTYAQYYRIDFSRVIINKMIKENEAITKASKGKK